MYKVSYVKKSVLSQLCFQREVMGQEGGRVKKASPYGDLHRGSLFEIRVK